MATAYDSGTAPARARKLSALSAAVVDYRRQPAATRATWFVAACRAAIHA